MKKIMMAAAIVFAAAAAQAASGYVDWTASGFGDSYKGHTCYLFDVKDSTKVLEWLAKYDNSTATKIGDGAVSSCKITTKGKATMNSTQLADSSVFAIAFADDIDAGTEYLYITEDVSSKMYNPPASSPGPFASSIATSGTKGVAGVPEPTSGLLMLMGGMLLGLRRKRA